MKIKSINIQGMHNVINHTYDITDCNYLYGKNGSGKSTVLEAIQLAILGYIPGYSKRTQDIMKHANSRLLSVKVTFDDENYIERTYMLSGGKVACDTDSSIQNISDITSDIEIPIYNFSSFLSLSANEQKKWFLGFLPQTYNFRDDFIWKDMFNEQCKGMAEYDERFLLELADNIERRKFQSVSEAHDYIKSVISSVKSQIKSKQAVLSDLMYYDDLGDCNIESVSEELEEKQNKFMEYNKKYSTLYIIEQKKENLEKYTQPTTENIEQEPVIVGFESKISEATTNIENLDKELEELTTNNDIEKRYTDLEKELSNSIRPTEVGSSCPYLPDIECNTLATHKKEVARIYKETKEKYDLAKQEYDSYCNKVEGIKTQKQALEESKTSFEQSLESTKESFKEYEDAKKDLDDYISNLDFTIDENETEESIKTQLDTLKQEIDKLNDVKGKILANKKYKEMSETNKRELNEQENHLVLLETLREYTGPNELQAELAEKPFVNLSSTITEYLKKMFNNDSLECWFNLSSRSNSFEFGIKRNGVTIPFTVLSSGEQCMYMLAMQSALMTSNKQEFSTILIDDAFDHLDSDNIITLVQAILNTEIQYIIAGVVEIPDTKELKPLNRIPIGG